MREKKLKFTISKSELVNSKSLQSTILEKDSLGWGKIWRLNKEGFILVWLKLAGEN